MPKKVKLNLTYSSNQLWWSADGGVNWAVVSEKSPVTVLDKDAEIQWIADDNTISDIEIIMNSNDLLDPVTGSSKAKKSKVKKGAQNNNKCKYSISINGGSFSADPEAKYCVPPCPPGGDG